MHNICNVEEGINVQDVQEEEINMQDVQEEEINVQDVQEEEISVQDVQEEEIRVQDVCEFCSCLYTTEDLINKHLGPVVTSMLILAQRVVRCWRWSTTTIYLSHLCATYPLDPHTHTSGRTPKPPPSISSLMLDMLLW